jgi:hypothetical protein
MPNIPVPAAATGLPSTSRRHVIAGLAASPIMAAPAIAATDNPDAALLALFDEWKRASAVQDAAFNLAGDAEEAIDEYNTTLPEAAKFRNGPRRAIKTSADCGDDLWQELRDLAARKSDASYYFRPDAYAELAFRVDITEWVPAGDQGCLIYSQDRAWMPPYCPPLRQRVQEILAAYTPWNAEREKLKASWHLDAKAKAAKDAIAQVEVIELKIARTRAFTEAGWRAKAVIIFSEQRSIDCARAEFIEKLADPDENTLELIEQSLVFDMVGEAQS